MADKLYTANTINFADTVPVAKLEKKKVVVEKSEKKGKYTHRQ